MIVFHIVQVNTPFLLCLADMVKLGAFFNNLTNQIVQSNRSHPVTLFYFGVLQLTLLSLSHLCKILAALLILSYVVSIAALDIHQSNVFNKS